MLKFILYFFCYCELIRILTRMESSCVDPGTASQSSAPDGPDMPTNYTTATRVESLAHQLHVSYKKLNAAREQIQLLNKKIHGLQQRFDMAKRQRCEAFCYSINLSLSVVERVRNCYYEYVLGLSEEIEQQRVQIQLYSSVDVLDEYIFMSDSEE